MYWRRFPLLAWSAVLGLAGLLWMNASFNGWDGGWCAGPRYLSLIFPLLAIAVAQAWDHISLFWRQLAVLLLLPALLLRALAYGVGAVVPAENLWLFYLDVIARAPPFIHGKIAFFILVLSALWLVTRKEYATQS